MSLSDTSEEKIEKGKSWTRFEMRPFTPIVSTEEKKETSFISMNEDKVLETDFIPFEEKGDIFKKREKARDIIKTAEGILKESKEKVSFIEQSAYEKGFAQGEKDGIEFGEKKIKKIIENMENILNEFGNLRTNIIKHYENDILRLIFGIAKKMTRFTIKSDEKAVKETVLKALHLAPEKCEVIVKVNTEDFDYIEETKPEFLSKFKELDSITVAKDPSVSRGGCLLETQYGEVDARIETQLESIFQSLEELFFEKDCG